MATCPSRRATLDSYSPVPTRTGKASRNESKTPARHERSSSIPVRTVRRTPREDENEPLLPRAHGTPSVKKSRRQPCPTPSRIPQRTNALFQNSGCVPLKGRLLSPAPGPFSHPSGTKQNPQKADYNQVFSIVQPTDFKDSSTPTLGCNSLLTSPTFQIPQYLDGPDVPSLFLGDQSFNHLKDSRDDADLVSSATPDLPQADAVTVASLLLDTQSFARLHYSTVKPRTGSNADQEATLTTFHQFTPISSHIEYENNGDEKILCATGPLKYAIQRNGGPNLSSLPSPSFSTPCTAGSTIPNTATSFSPSLSSTTASPTWIPPATMGSPSSFASASISYSGIKPSLTIETMRLGGIDISLAIIKEESEDSPASTIRCRIPTSASSERETLKLLNEFESLAVQMKHLPVPAPVSGSLPRSLEERKIVASGARSNVKTHYRREVSGIGGAHVQGSKSDASHSTSVKTCYSSDAPSTLSGSTKYECNSPPSNRKYLSPSPTPATRCRNLSDKSLSRRDLNDHSPTPQRRFDQPTPNLFPSPTPNVFSIPHRNISRSPEVLLSCGGFPLHEVDCSKPLPPRPSKYFPQSPSLKKLFHASSSKAKVMVQPAKSTPPRYANTRGGPVSNHFHASPVNGRGSKDKVESRSFRNLFKKGAGTRAGESFFDF